ncbi:MAG: outer membrane lipoprotein-sorting protein [Betaproteobacteria bacterium]|nr:outer membrane lipoprotein-sorting protein [Betaproteobacteria bacterium]
MQPMHIPIRSVRRPAWPTLLLPWLLAFAAAALAQTPAEPVDDPAARSILEKADQIRFPQEGFQVDIAIVTSKDGQPTEERKYRVLSKGNENTIVQVTEPASERGQIMLMKGRDLWIFLPSVSQPVRLSLAQRLTGQVANGDLARANFVGDYSPRLLRTEVVDGEKTDVLELTAVDRSVTYQRVLLWVRHANQHPHKAEFYTASGRLLKTCLYQNFERMAGRLRPTRLVMEDALRKGEQSVLEYSAMKLRDLPDKVFTKDYLKRLE